MYLYCAFEQPKRIDNIEKGLLCTFLPFGVCGRESLGVVAGVASVAELVESVEVPSGNF